MTGRGTRSHTTRWVALAALAALVGVGVVLATRTPQEATQIESPLLGHLAPQLSGADLRTGTRVSLSALRGHYVLVNFFASWCVPCQQEAPDLITFEYHQQHGGGGANLLSVVFHDQTSSARQFLKAQGATWPAVSDPGGRSAEEYGVSDPPTTFLVDPSGRISVNPIIGPATQANLDALLHSARMAVAHG